MSQRFIRCPHCKGPHDARVKRCPVLGKSLALPAAKKAGPEPAAFASPKRDAERPSEVLEGQGPGRKRRDAGALKTGLGKRYVLKAVLGQGGMGVVYDAVDENLDRGVAVKILAQEHAARSVAVTRFKQEAQAAGQIVHPNICRVFDCGTLDDGRPYLVMERLVGRTLHDYMVRERVLEPRFITQAMIGVLSGLAAAHERGVLHRDIKPDNIFLAKQGGDTIPKILDFGVSKIVSAASLDEDEHSLTRTGMVMGTPEYLSPEQASGERKMDGRVDTYAVGIVMYQALVGERPFKGKDPRALLLAIVKGEHRKLSELRPDLPMGLLRVVQKAMARSKTDRFQSAESFAQALAVVLPSLPIDTHRGRSRTRMPIAERVERPDTAERGESGGNEAPKRVRSSESQRQKATVSDGDDRPTRVRRG